MGTSLWPTSVALRYPVVETPKFRTNIVDYGNDVEQRISLSSAARYEYTLNLEPYVNADKKTIMDFFVARKGAFESFPIPATYINPNSTSTGVNVQVRFLEDSLNAEYFTYQLWNLGQVKLIQVASS